MGVSDLSTKPKNAVLEGVKEVLRLILFAVPGIVITYLTDLPQNETIAIVLVVLRFIDKAVHESEKIPARGISPF